ncbi:MAG: alcohol dehydrogenase [Verrucomicrobiales bacterium]|jgi:alcohol dehydrogenase
MKKIMMKAAQFTEFGAKLQITERPSPSTPEDGVLIEVKAAGVCRSDWHAWQGHDPDIKSLPHVLGHEFSGTIAAIGERLTGWQIGDRVTAPFACGCGSCVQCSSGHTQVCPDQYQPGVTGPGAFAEFVAIPRAATNLVRLPESVSFAAAASLGCRFATAYRALAHADQANLQPGEHVAIFGCGGVGLSAVMIARALGAEVTAIDIRDSALQSAADLGATPCHFDAIDHLRADVTVDALGKTETCLAAINSLKPRGRHVQVGLMLAEDAVPPIPIGAIIAKELKLIGSHGMGAAGYPELLRHVASGKLRPDKLIARAISLDQLPDALEQMGVFQTEPGLTIVERF